MNTAIVSGKILLNVDQAAAYLGVRPSTLERYRRERRGPPYSKRTGRVMYDQADIDRWWAEGKQDTPEINRRPHKLKLRPRHERQIPSRT